MLVVGLEESLPFQGFRLEPPGRCRIPTVSMIQAELGHVPRYLLRVRKWLLARFMYQHLGFGWVWVFADLARLMTIRSPSDWCFSFSPSSCPQALPSKVFYAAGRKWDTVTVTTGDILGGSSHLVAGHSPWLESPLSGLSHIYCMIINIYEYIYIYIY